MKSVLLFIAIVLCNVGNCNSQEWMTSLPIAKKLALAQDKFLFMMWEEAAYYQGPVMLADAKGNLKVENDFLNNERINEAIWKHFVPVLVNESEYEELYNNIKEKRKQSYLTAFNDDSMKIMDPNGNIIGTSPSYSNFYNLSSFINKYAYKTTFFKNELLNYSNKKDFYSALYLALRYIDFAVYVNKDIRSEILDLSTIYFNEAEELLINNDDLDQIKLQQNLELYKLSQYLVLRRPKKVLRALKKTDAKVLAENKSLVAFLNYTAYLLMEDKKNAELWKNEVSLVNLRKARLINNIY